MLNDLKISFKAFVINPFKTIMKYSIPMGLKNPPADDPEDEKAWKEKERLRLEDLKKNHFILWLLEKVEPYLMYGGFIAFLLEPVFRSISEPLSVFCHILSGGAMGLGFASWMSNKRLWKTNFSIMRYTLGFFDKVKQELDDIDLKTIDPFAEHKGFEDPRKPRRAD